MLSGANPPVLIAKRIFYEAMVFSMTTDAVVLCADFDFVTELKLYHIIVFYRYNLHLAVVFGPTDTFISPSYSDSTNATNDG